jgi:hypothetical protein
MDHEGEFCKALSLAHLPERGYNLSAPKK